MVSYLAGSLTTINLPLPVPLTKFFEGVSLDQTDFFERWKAIGGAQLESQVIFAINLDANGLVNTPRSRKIVSGHSFSLLDGVDPSTTNLVGAGILHTSGTGKHGCLLRVEPNQDAKVRFVCCTIIYRLQGANQRQLCRLTVRSTSEGVSQQVVQALQKSLSKTSALS